MAMCKICSKHAAAGEVIHKRCLRTLLIETCWERCMDHEIDLKNGTPGDACRHCRINQVFGLFPAKEAPDEENL